MFFITGIKEIFISESWFLFTATPVVYENEKIDEDDDTELQLALKKARRLKMTPPDKFAARLPVSLFYIFIIS